MVLECYQTLEDRGNPDEVEQSGPFPCNRSDVWLGAGYYFWDTNIRWAHEWGKAYERKQKSYLIGQVSIRCDETIFDLFGNVAHLTAFEEAYNLLLIRQMSIKYPRHNKPVLVRDVIRFLQKTNTFPYNGIRASDEPKGGSAVLFNSNRHEVLVIHRRVQVCLTTKNNIVSHPFRIIFPDKYVN
jgi:hypothetical protein